MNSRSLIRVKPCENQTELKPQLLVQVPDAAKERASAKVGLEIARGRKFWSFYYKAPLDSNHRIVDCIPSSKMTLPSLSKARVRQKQHPRSRFDREQV